MKKAVLGIVLLVFIAAIVIAGFYLTNKEEKGELIVREQLSSQAYPVHHNITVTVFWAGELAAEENRFISNIASAWDDEWEKHSSSENQFYFALPYNDFTSDGERKSGAYEVVYRAREKNWTDSESMLKNRWIKITKGDKSAYAQWEDVGPFGEDDSGYVFGSSQPKNKENDNAGLDVSPAVRDYLQLEDIDKVDWQFVEAEEVENGRWKTVVTNSKVNWA